jgi:hypothetical protein
VNQVTTKLREMTERLASTNEDIQNSLTQGNTMTERAYNDITRSYESLQKEVTNFKNENSPFYYQIDKVPWNKKAAFYNKCTILIIIRK